MGLTDLTDIDCIDKVHMCVNSSQNKKTNGF